MYVSHKTDQSSHGKISIIVRNMEGETITVNIGIYNRLHIPS